jgi:hypothetical protein|tara:strand:- start:273 stop:467 length:195 start_codon:yes stop_codon:yes gene_type:complete
MGVSLIGQATQEQHGGRPHSVNLVTLPPYPIANILTLFVKASCDQGTFSAGREGSIGGSTLEPF